MKIHIGSLSALHEAATIWSRKIDHERKKMRTLRRVLLSTMACTLYCSTANAEYTITDLGLNATPTAINDLGQVVGTKSGAGAFLYSYGTMQYLGASDSDAAGINNSGQIALNINSSAYLYSNGTMTNLGSLGGGYASAASINNSGQIVGRSDSSVISCGILNQGCANRIEAFLYSNGSMTRIHGTSFQDNASAINNNGQITGTTGNIRGVWTSEQGWVNSNGITTDLTQIGGFNSRTYDINDNGQIVGFSDFVVGGARAATLFSHGNQINLGTLGNDVSSIATAINNHEQIVGRSYSNYWDPTHPFLFEAGTMFDLNSLLGPNQGWTLTDALDINELGQIVGTGTFNGQTHGFLLTPSAIPIPGAVWLFGSGLISLLGFTRRGKVVN